MLSAEGSRSGIRGMCRTRDRNRDDLSPTLAPGIVGESASLRLVLEQVAAVAASDTTVLIQGETGTGKERIARALHDSSKRARGPFVTVNCAAIPATLLEAELMGHERGAFTGATNQRLGRFELAHDGTLFLDELGELPLALQPKLLRILQEREFERLGSSRTRTSNARVVAATNRDLKTMVAHGTFRQDLYYRVTAFPILVPPLRERAQDIPLLARHFVREFAERMERCVEPPCEASLARLIRYDWPGNIRELQNVIERAVILTERGPVHVPDLRAAAPAHAPRALLRANGAGTRSLAEISKAHILHVLNETNWVVAGPRGAAAKLELARTTLNFRMKKLGIVRPSPSGYTAHGQSEWSSQQGHDCCDE
jgi:transcriptional regulator with GAF, ATPase, and Fis domain